MRRLIFLFFTITLVTFGMVIANAPPASAALGQNLLLNPGLEAPNPLAPGLGPQYWMHSSWGDLTDAATYVTNDGHGGTHSVRVDISTWGTEGDSKWMPAEAIPVTGGRYYTFSDWYKSDVSTAVSVYYERATDAPDHGTWANLYSGISPASSWTQYTTGFTMPADAVRAYFVHFVARPGYLQTDDYSMKEEASPPGFTRPLVSLTFDDGSEGFWQNARPLLDARSYKTTQYVPTATLGNDEFMMTPQQIRELYNDGHEIGSHSVTHPELPTLSDAELQQEFTASKVSLEAIVGEGNVVNFAYPFGLYDARVIAAEQAAGYASGRSVEVGYNTRGDLEPYDIRVQNMTPATTLDEFTGWLAFAKAHNYWLVIVYHEVQPAAFPVCTNPDTEDNCVGPYDTTVPSFTAQLDAIAAAGLGANVVTVQQALAEIGTPTAPPDAPTVTGGPGDVVKDTTAAFTATPAAGSTLQYRLDKTSSDPWTDGNLPPQFTGLAQGTHKLEVRGVAGGQYSTVVTRTWTVDTTPPAPKIDSGPAAETTETTATFTFSAAAESGVTFEASIDGGTYADVQSAKSYPGLTVGAHTFQLRATDKAGNTSPPVTHAWTIKPPAPAPPKPPTVTGGPQGVVPNTSATFTVTPAAGSTFEYRLDKASDGPWTPGDTSPLVFTSLSNGLHKLEVRSVAGEQYSEAVTREWTIKSPTGGGTANPPVTTAPPAATPPSAASVAPPAAEPAPAALKARLALPRQRLRSVLAHGLRVVASSSRAGTGQVQLVAGADTARRLGLGRRATVVGTATTALTGIGQKTLTIRLTKKAKQRLARARSVALNVRLLVTVPGGEQARTTSHVTVRR